MMETEQKSNGGIMGIVIIVILLIIGGFFAWQNSVKQKAEQEAKAKAEKEAEAKAAGEAKEKAAKEAAEAAEAAYNVLVKRHDAGENLDAKERASLVSGMKTADEIDAYIAEEKTNSVLKAAEATKKEL